MMAKNKSTSFLERSWIQYLDYPTITNCDGLDLDWST